MIYLGSLVWPTFGPALPPQNMHKFGFRGSQKDKNSAKIRRLKILTEPHLTITKHFFSHTKRPYGIWFQSKVSLGKLRKFRKMPSKMVGPTMKVKKRANCFDYDTVQTSLKNHLLVSCQYLLPFRRRYAHKLDQILKKMSSKLTFVHLNFFLAKNFLCRFLDDSEKISIFDFFWIFLPVLGITKNSIEPHRPTQTRIEPRFTDIPRSDIPRSVHFPVETGECHCDIPRSVCSPVGTFSGRTFPGRYISRSVR